MREETQNAEKYLVKAFSANENSFEIINNLAGFYRKKEITINLFNFIKKL